MTRIVSNAGRAVIACHCFWRKEWKRITLQIGLIWDQELLDKFVTDVLVQLASRKNDEPERAVQVAKRLGVYLDEIIHGEERDQVSEKYHILDGTVPANGNAASNPRDVDGPPQGRKSDGVGKHLISRLRELVMLEFLNQETRPVPLHEVQGEVVSKGFEGVDNAVISQLHRLHQNGTIAKPEM